MKNEKRKEQKRDIKQKSQEEQDKELKESYKLGIKYYEKVEKE